MVGPKADLPAGGIDLDTAVLLPPCVYRGMTDTALDKWTYYKVSMLQGQMLKVAFRLRDLKLPEASQINYNWGGVTVRLHAPNGGAVAGTYENTASGAKELEYKASESGFAYISLHLGVRDSVLQVEIAPAKPKD